MERKSGCPARSRWRIEPWSKPEIELAVGQGRWIGHDNRWHGDISCFFVHGAGRMGQLSGTESRLV